MMPTTHAPLTVAVAGSTIRTRKCLEALAATDQFIISWVLTPSPRPVGRTQTLVSNPVHDYATDHQIPTILVERSLTPSLTNQIIANNPKPDFLLVVDFGYLVPDDLLAFNQLGAVNVHPSALPRWRGSSPGQFVLLSGETVSAVTIMLMDSGLDTGPILEQHPLDVKPDWTQVEYYQASFEVACQALPGCLTRVAADHLAPQPQPHNSPTPIAQRLSKADSYVAWSVLQPMLVPSQQTSTPAPITLEPSPTTDVPTQTSPLLSQFASDTPWATVLERAARAFSPWPGLWTYLPTKKGWRRCKLLKVVTQGSHVELPQVQLEGLQPTTWQEIANQL